MNPRSLAHHPFILEPLHESGTMFHSFFLGLEVSKMKEGETCRLRTLRLTETMLVALPLAKN